MHKLSNIDHAINILHWDASTYMPKGSSAARSDDLAGLVALKHQIFTDESTGDLIALAKEENLDEWQQANLYHINRDYIHATALSEELVKRQAQASSKCEFIWRDARKNNDFNTLHDSLDEVFSICKQLAQIKSEKFNISKYDALIDQYAPGLKVEDIDKVFALLKQELPNLITQITAKQKSYNTKEIKGLFPQDKQKKLGIKIMQQMGFDFNRGRLDISAHPFCGGTHYDVRLTTRYNEDEFISSLMGIIHETGHGLYDLNFQVFGFNPPTLVGRAGL